MHASQTLSTLNVKRAAVAMHMPREDPVAPDAANNARPQAGLPSVRRGAVGLELLCGCETCGRSHRGLLVSKESSDHWTGGEEEDERFSIADNAGRSVCAVLCTCLRAKASC